MVEPRDGIYLPKISLGSVLTILGGLVSIGIFLVALGGWKADLATTNVAQDIKIDALSLDQKALMHKMNQVEARVISIDDRLATILPVKKAEAQ